MSMTRDEIIEAYESAVFSSGLSAAAGNEQAVRDYELLKAGLDALRGPTREMVERMRGHWVGVEGEEVKTDEYGCPIGAASCSVCDDYLMASDEYSCRGHFCPACGAPMTDEAVEMVMERLEALYE